MLWQNVESFWYYVYDGQLDGVKPAHVPRSHTEDDPSPLAQPVQSAPVLQTAVELDHPSADGDPSKPTTDTPDPPSIPVNWHTTANFTDPVIQHETEPSLPSVDKEPSARSADYTIPTSTYLNWYNTSSCSAPSAFESIPIEAPNIASSSIEAERKVWRSSLPSCYIEPDDCPDVLDGMEVIFKEHGKSLRRQTTPIPARNDILYFDEAKHQKELDDNIRWRDCPTEHQPEFLSMIKRHWDVFAEEGLRRPILGFECRVDTGDVKPVCCKPPRYGPHEAKIMTDLVDKLRDNGLVEDDDGPWGALIVLATKAQHEANVPWHAYDWRLCVSYRKLNQVTRPFTFPIPRCDDAVSDLPPEAQFKILTDMFSGYWQVVVEEGSRGKLAFFTPDGKVHWMVMPMGLLNAHATFIAMMTKICARWNALAAELGLHDVGCTIIVDDVMLWALTVVLLMAYFECVLQTLKEYRATLKLKKTFLLPQEPEFVGYTIESTGNSPAKTKYAAFTKIPPPETWSDLAMLIGMFGFYQQWIALYEVRIQPWRAIQALRPKPGEASMAEETALMKQAWKASDDAILAELKQDVLDGPVLARPSKTGLFALKTDWSNTACGAVLCQADPEHPDTPILMEAVMRGEKCPFDLTKSGPRFRPIAFISRKSTDPEKSYHSYVGEAGAGRWAMIKFRKWLLGRPFIWLTDCSGLTRFFETADDAPTHMVQRWRAELLQFDYRLEHRPAAMMAECDMLSRYNKITASWRDEAIPPTVSANASWRDDIISPPAVPVNTAAPFLELFEPEHLEEDRQPLIHMMNAPEYRGQMTWKATSAIAQAADPFRSILLDATALVPLEPAIISIGMSPKCINRISDNEKANSSSDWFDMLSRTMHAPPIVHWYIAVYPDSQYHTPRQTSYEIREWLLQRMHQAKEMVTYASTQAIILVFPTHIPDPPTTCAKICFARESTWSGWNIREHPALQQPAWWSHRNRPHGN